MSGLLEQRLALLEARVAALETGGGNGGGASRGSAGGAVASDYEMSGAYGDPTVRKDPPRWLKEGGESYAGQPMSACPPEYLLSLAGFFDWQASKDEEQGKTYTNKKGEVVPTAVLRRKDAALARGWAKRNANAQPAAPRAQARRDDFEADSEVPF